MSKDKAATTKWNKSNLSYVNYQKYLKRKPANERFKLTLIDLLYVSNFKGGNASIHQEEADVIKNLKAYSKILQEIENEFPNADLRKLDKNRIDKLIAQVQKLFDLSKKKTETHIDGFSVSYISALAHFYFPDLIPILDRRVLNGLDIIGEDDYNNQKQVKDLASHFKRLVEDLHAELKEESNDNVTLRDLDEKDFAVKIEKSKQAKEDE